MYYTMHCLFANKLIHAGHWKNSKSGYSLRFMPAAQILQAMKKGMDIIMNIYICVGSSCHLKGSYDIIQLMKEALATHSLEDKVNLSATFCLGHCTDGVSVKINEGVICGVSKENFTEFFKNNVLSQFPF